MTTAATRAWPLAAVGSVVLVDLAVSRIRPPLLWHGALDETAHLLTTAVLLAAWNGSVGARARVAVVPALVATVLVDVDHVPQALLGSEVLTQGTPRPYSHSLSTLVVLVGVAWLLRADRHARWRRILLGCAVGVGLHLVRDLATAPVALLWPLWPGGLVIPYPAYLVVLTVAGVLATARRRPAGPASALHSRSTGSTPVPPYGRRRRGPHEFRSGSRP